MHEVLVNRLGGLNLPRKNVVRLTDRPDMTLDVYCGRKTIQHTTIIKKHFIIIYLYYYIYNSINKLYFLKKKNIIILKNIIQNCFDRCAPTILLKNNNIRPHFNLA